MSMALFFDPRGRPAFAWLEWSTAHGACSHVNEEAAIKRCYENGEPVKDIARRFDVAWSTVTRIAARHKLARRGNVAFKRRLASIRNRNIAMRMSTGGAPSQKHRGQ